MNKTSLYSQEICNPTPLPHISPLISPFYPERCGARKYQYPLRSPSIFATLNRVRNFRGRVTNFNQSEARKQCFLASDWLKFETLPRKFRTLFSLTVTYTVLISYDLIFLIFRSRVLKARKKKVHFPSNRKNLP